MSRVRVGFVLRYTALGAALAVPAAVTVASAIVNGTFPDFHGGLWQPGHLIRAGLSPFPGPHASMFGAPSVYMPPPVLAVGVPLSFLPLAVAGVLWGAAMAGCSLGSLWLMGVRDWRCYVAAIPGGLFLSSIVSSNSIPLTVFLVAVAYRLGRRPVGAGIAVGVAVLVKPFAFPMIVWRSSRQAVAAAGTVLLATAGAWAAIDFHGLRGYAHLMARLTQAQGSHGSSLYALAAHLGASQRTGTLLALAAGGLVLVLGRGGFNAAVLASLLASPIEWAGYSALLYLVIAVESPRFSFRWLFGMCYAPALMYTASDRPIWTIVLGLVGAFWVCTTGLRRRLVSRSRLAGRREAAEWFLGRRLGSSNSGLPAGETSR